VDHIASQKWRGTRRLCLRDCQLAMSWVRSSQGRTRFVGRDRDRSLRKPPGNAGAHSARAECRARRQQSCGVTLRHSQRVVRRYRGVSKFTFGMRRSGVLPVEFPRNPPRRRVARCPGPGGRSIWGPAVRWVFRCPMQCSWAVIWSGSGVSSWLRPCRSALRFGGGVGPYSGHRDLVLHWGAPDTVHCRSATCRRRVRRRPVDDPHPGQVVTSVGKWVWVVRLVVGYSTTWQDEPGRGDAARRSLR
jgi:hypothetical protein